MRIYTKSKGNQQRTNCSPSIGLRSTNSNLEGSELDVSSESCSPTALPSRPLQQAFEAAMWLQNCYVMIINIPGGNAQIEEVLQQKNSASGSISCCSRKVRDNRGLGGVTIVGGQECGAIPDAQVCWIDILAALA